MNNINEVKINLERLSITTLNINHILCLIKIYLNTEKKFFDYKLNDIDIEYLKVNKYILVYKERNIEYSLRSKGEKILKQIVTFTYPTEEKIKLIINQDKIESFDSKVKLYRNKFNGLKLGSMGVLKDVKSKLKRWMKDNPDVTFKEILQATDMYIDSLKSYEYLQRADYFIYKQNSKREETSRLSIFIEELRKEPENSDWTANII